MKNNQFIILHRILRYDNYTVHKLFQVHIKFQALFTHFKQYLSSFTMEKPGSEI